MNRSLVSGVNQALISLTTCASPVASTRPSKVAAICRARRNWAAASSFSKCACKATYNSNPAAANTTVSQPVYQDTNRNRIERVFILPRPLR